jgi:uncharacterized protein YyaL (SSP411 family)
MMLERYCALARDLLTRPGSSSPAETHVREAIAWLYRAQDAGSDRGVSHSYFIGRGWLPSYPETTGYIIPTLLNVWKEMHDAQARQRALEMADWELSVQLPGGAIPGLVSYEPVVFDTGQVIFGWVSAFQATQDERYLAAARNAGAWLLREVDGDGTWRRFGGSSTGATFNARVAWALVELGAAAGEERYADAARRFLEWSLAQEEDCGWFGLNCLNDNDRPLLHTIAYTAEGQLEAGLLLGDARFVEAAARTARALVARVGPEGRMAGRFDRAWRPTVRWSCLTGMAQISHVWARLHAVAPDAAFAEAAQRVNAFLTGTQDIRSRPAGLRGGIRGSFPVNGAYCRYRVPNWATKFFVDALLYDPAAGRCAAFKG